ncbi:DUF4232 domain-containing protein [Streptomyces sp. SBT349]|uniref:DUF4232 domain-containing protein n=1 Tax=Streptomyces sp. SBT349 TaxID=1580539 RepID=UPI00066CCBF2|nr:DUF4232 domain-containing protein [Streptomyces sp. SBT349]
MTSRRHDPRDTPGGPNGPERPGEAEPSELAEVFAARVTPLAPPPGAFAAVRRRAATRRRGRVLAAAAAAAVCLAGSTTLIAMTRETGGPLGTPAASGPSHGATTDLAPTGQDGGEGPGGEAGEAGEPSASPGGTPTEEVTTEGQPAEPPGDGSSVEAAGCATDALAVEVGAADAGAGSMTLPLAFTNEGETTCALTGWPGVSLAEEGGTAGGAGIGSPAARGEEAGPAVRVELAPGATAQADLRVTRAENHPAEDCDPVPAGGLRVYPPDETAAVFLPREGLTGCRNEGVTLLTVTVLHPPSP